MLKESWIALLNEREQADHSMELLDGNELDGSELFRAAGWEKAG